jgi:hypothetical protein
MNRWLIMLMLIRIRTSNSRNTSNKMADYKYLDIHSKK